MLQGVQTQDRAREIILKGRHLVNVIHPVHPGAPGGVIADVLPARKEGSEIRIADLAQLGPGAKLNDRAFKIMIHR